MEIPCKECVSIIKPMCGEKKKIVCDELYEWIQLGEVHSYISLFDRRREIVKHHNITTKYISVEDEKGNCYGWNANMMKE